MFDSLVAKWFYDWGLLLVFLILWMYPMFQLMRHVRARDAAAAVEQKRHNDALEKVLTRLVEKN